MQLRHLVKNEMLLVKTGNGLFCGKALGLLGQRGAFPKASLLRQEEWHLSTTPHMSSASHLLGLEQGFLQKPQGLSVAHALLSQPSTPARSADLPCSYRASGQSPL